MEEGKRNNPFFSIIVPAYNVKDYIEQCLKSILDQKFDSFEVIIIDDGSSDGTGKIIDNFYYEFPNIMRVFHKKNEGLSMARNDGILAANGEYLFFVDSDDWIEDVLCLNKLEQFIINKKKPEVVINRVQICKNDTNRISSCTYFFDEKLNYMKPLNVMNSLLKIPNIYLMAQAFVIRRKFIMDNDIFFLKGIYYEDTLWFPRVFINVKHLALNNQEVYCYRTSRRGSIVNNVDCNKWQSHFCIIRQLCNCADELSGEDKTIILNWARSIYRNAIIESNRMDTTSKKDTDLIDHILHENIGILKDGEIKDRICYRIERYFGISNLRRILLMAYKI